MEKKIAFMSTGCQSSFGRPREIIASIPELVEVNKREHPDYVMANFCAISTENIDVFDTMKYELLQMKRANPQLKILAGGCIEGLSVKKDLSFADAIYHHQEEATAFLHFLGYDSIADLHPAIIYDTAYIVIAQGCNRRCTFCKVHYLDYMRVTSRPIAEIVALVYSAIDHGIYNIHLNAENSTEYGCDIGTNICELLQAIFAISKVRYVDISGLCLDEISPQLLKLLQNPKTRQLQIEIQSLNDLVRKSMGLHKNSREALAILDALHDKAVTSNFITGFVNSNVKEFDKELKLIRAHHLHFLTLSPYDDTINTPSHQFYQKPSKSELFYYQSAFTTTVAAERQLLLEQLKAEESIEASVAIVTDDGKYTLTPAHHAIKIIARNPNHIPCQVGDVVHVKITKLHQLMSEAEQHELLVKLEVTRDSTDNAEYATLLQNMQYFGDYDQIMMVKGVIVAP